MKWVSHELLDIGRLEFDTEGGPTVPMEWQTQITAPTEYLPVTFDKDYPHTGKIEIYIHELALKKMLDYVWQYRDLELEVMGLMIGELYEWEGQNYTIVKDIITAKVDASLTSVRFTKDAFQELFSELDKLDYEYLLVGWYHSHPGHTCFLSEVDIKTNRTMFKLPYQTAIVIDPLTEDIRAYTHCDIGFREKSFAVIAGGFPGEPPEPPFDHEPVTTHITEPKGLY